MDIKKNIRFTHSPQPNTDNEIEHLLQIQRKLEDRSCLGGKEFLGWLDGPKLHSSVAKKFVQQIKQFSQVIIIGIGGSINGSRGLIKLIQPQSSADITFTGWNMDTTYHQTIIDRILTERSTASNVALLIISKSGNTLEVLCTTKIWISALRHYSNKSAIDIAQQIFLISDDPAITKKSNLLWDQAITEKWQVFASQSDIIGRFSLLSETGLIPCSLAGIRIEKLIQGAINMRKLCKENCYEKNLALQLAHFRFMMHCQKNIEALTFFCPQASELNNWIAQLFAESEGKAKKGLWPLRLQYSSDLHSIGQMLQDGPKNCYELQFLFEKSQPLQSIVPEIAASLQQMQHYQDKLIVHVRRARTIGQIPLAQIWLPEISEYFLGALVYLLQYSCTLTALKLGVNPFNQPGVEEYKKHLL